MDERIEIWNGIALIRDDTHFTKWVKEHKSLCTDPHHLAAVKKYIPVGGVVIDGGANIGTFTVPYAELVGETGLVYAFEPNPLAFKCLVHNCKNYHRVRVNNLAIGATEGFCSVIDDSKNHGMAHCEKAIEDKRPLKLLAYGKIEVVTIDDEFQHSRLDFIKLDIEGWELDALKGATETIKRFRPVLDVEVNDATLARMGLTDKDVYDYIESIGYEIADIIGVKPQVDIICVPR